MIGIGLNIGNRVMGGGGAAFDVDAQAFFDRVTAAGGTLTTTEKNATNQLVLDMKSAGIWTAMKAIYPMVGGGTGTTAARQAACEQNLKSSSFTGTFTSGWTFASTGVTGNGTSAYMNTGWDTNNNASYNNFSIGYYSGTDIANGGIFGSGNPGLNAYVHIYPRTASNFYIVYMNEANGYLVPNTDSRGFFQNSINGTAVVGQFRNSAYSTTLTPINGNTFDIYFGASNVNGTAAGFDSREIRFAYLGDNITSTNISNFYTAVQAFQTTLSRQV